MVSLLAMIAPAPPSPHKRTHGQFYTAGNPFVFDAFAQWMDVCLTDRDPEAAHPRGVLEPFAGGNSIVRLMREAGYAHLQWNCFDIDPPAPICEGIAVARRDTLRDFPEGYRVAITNPPYLARNSAVRRGLSYPTTPYNDLYKHSLDIALKRVPYVAAIIPDSFAVAGLFHDRLAHIVSLTSKMFNDTDCPVCLALFVPAASKPDQDDFLLWDGDELLGNYRKFASAMAPVDRDARVAWRFNDPHGELGLMGVDNARQASIRFVPGSSIASTEIKHSSRAISRISGVPADIDLDRLIAAANQSLGKYRSDTHDTLMTSFKGLRADGKYRRRLDFATARHLLDHCVADLRKSAPSQPGANQGNPQEITQRA